jgi:hypothetical protein
MNRFFEKLPFSALTPFIMVTQIACGGGKKDSGGGSSSADAGGAASAAGMVKGISELLRTRLTTGNEFRFYLLVNIQSNEAEEVMTDDGKAGTMEIGVEYKNVTEMDWINYRVFLEEFENDYSVYRNQLKEFIKSETQEHFQDRTWEQAVEEYVQGKGCKNKVLDIYKNELTLFASMINVRDNDNSKWNEIVKENSLSSQIDNACVPCTQTKDKE